MEHEFLPHDDRYDPPVPPEEALRLFHECMRRRRSVRAFSERPVAPGIIEGLVGCAGWAPSAANKQPWRFVCVSNPEIKRTIRHAAEEQERTFYEQRAGEDFLRDLAPLGTGVEKEFLEKAPWLIAVFTITRGDDGSPVYYPTTSLGIAVGILLSAAQHAGLATLPYTPNPITFLSTILQRPANEKPYMIIPVGYPAETCMVPAIALTRKPLEEILIMRE